jgi:hypothetical protein
MKSKSFIAASLCIFCILATGIVNAETLYFAFEGEFVTHDGDTQVQLGCDVQVPTRFKACYSVQSDAPDLFPDTSSGGYSIDTFWVEFSTCHFETGSVFDLNQLTYHDAVYSAPRDIHEVQVYGIPDYAGDIDYWDANLGLLALGLSDMLSSDDLPSSAPDISLADQAHFTFWGWAWEEPYFPTGPTLFGWVDAYYAATSDCQKVIEAPTLACAGFEPPMANYPVTVKKNRALPLKAELFDAEGSPVLGSDLSAPPILQVWQGYGTPEADDVSDDALPAGQGTEGNQFVFTDALKWQFNLKTSNYSGPGTYTVIMESGDPSEYVIDPSCLTEFVVK